MAAKLGSLFVELTANVQPYVQGMTRAESTTARVTSAITRQAGISERAVQSFSKSTGGSNFRPYGLIAVSRAFDNAADRAALLRGALLSTTAVFGGFSAALSSNLILRYADSYTKLSNQIRVVSDSSADAMARFEGIQEVATRSRSSLEATAVLYSRIQKAAPTLAADEVLRYVETIQKALVLGGATAQEARSAALQFSQAIASNRLGGEELRAILETPLGLELAKGLGVTIGKLREMSTAGELTATAVLGALSKIGPGVDEQFGRSIKTVDQALTLVDNRLTEFIGSTDKAYGVTKLLASAIGGFGNNLETILPVLGSAAAALASAFVARRLTSAGGGLIGSIRTQAKTAADEVINLRKQVGDLQSSLVTAGIARSAAAKSLLGDSTGFADPGAAKGLERAQYAEERLAKRHAELLQQRVQANLDLQNVTATTSARVVKLTQDQINAETRLAAAQRQFAINRENPKLADRSSQEGQRVSAEQHALNKEMIKIREESSVRIAQINALDSASDRKAAQERTAALRQLMAVEREISNVTLARGVAALDTRQARGDVSISGDRNARAILTEQSAAVGKLQAALGPVTTQLAAAEKANTKFGMASAFVRTQVGSLVGLFGGPWGVAITGAILAMGYLGLKSQESAQKIANAQQIINDAIDKAAESGGVEAKLSQQERLAKRLSDNLAKVGDEYDRIVAVAGGNIPSITFGTGAEFGEVAQQVSVTSQAVSDLLAKFKSGAINAAELKAGLQDVGKQEPGIRGITDALIAQIPALNDAVIAAQRLRQAFADVAKVKLPSFRETENKSMSDLADDTVKGTAEIVNASNQELAVLRLKAQGRTAEAAALKKIQDARNNGKIVDEEAIKSSARAVEAENERVEAFQRGAREAQSFAEKLKRLKEEGQGAFLGDLDRSVLEHARQMRATADELKAYVEGAKTGNFNGVSPKIMELRDIEVLKKAGAESRGIIQTYGNWTQIAPLAAEQQRILDAAVASGAITAGQAKIAYADFLGTFGNYKWIDSAADAFGQFASDVLSDSNSIDQALTNLRKAFQKMVIDEAIVSPLKNLIKAGLAQLPGLIGGIGGGWTGGTPLAGGLPIGMGGIGARAKGDAFGPGGVIPFAKGGIVNHPTIFPFARGAGLMGEAGPEAIMPLARGRDGSLGVRLSGMAEAANRQTAVVNNFIVENHTGANVEKSQQKNSSGGMDHKAIIRGEVKQGFADGDFQGPLNTRARAPQRVIRR